MAGLLEERGSLQERFEKWDLAKIDFEQAFEIFQREGNWRRALIMRIRLVDILRRTDLAEAERLLREEILPEAEQGDDLRVQTVAREVLEHILVNQGKLSDTLVLLNERQLPAWQELGDRRALALTTMRMASLWLHLDRSKDEALDLLQKSTTFFKETRESFHLAQALSGTTVILVGQGKYDEALRILQEQLPVFERFGNPTTISITRSMIELLQSSGK
ncbi:MAG: hypothetical protein HQL51_16030 [Magnetococcales bacterium]|nr:hypothetical protein [Magnetococcales bacterium]